MTAPKLRLAGFKEPWSPKRLGATGRILQERTSDFARYPLYSLTIEKGVTKKTARYERSFLVSKTGDIFKIVHPGNFVTNPMNLRFGAVGYSKEKDDVSVSGYYDVFELDDNKCSPFWFNFLKREGMKKRYEDIATGSLIEKKRVHVNDLLNLELPIPELDERMSIGEYHASLDRLIDAEVLRLERLRKLKSACLEKMFVHDGENCPRLRLSGFKGNWAQFRFGKIVERRSESSMQKGLPRVEYADIRSGEGRLVDGYTGLGNHKKGIRFQKGDVLFGKLRPYLRNNLCATFDGIAVGDFWVLHSSDKILDGGFLFRLVETESFQRVANTSVGSKMPRSDWNYVSDSIVSVPQEFEEQVAIVKFFADLDELINLAAFEQERMRHLKSACMERMFV